MADTGQRVGDYEVIAPIGAGGMGRIFKVRNVISGREEAMKILLPDLASDEELAARFMAEIRTLAGLEHPGIAQLRTAFQHNNQLVMVMEFVEGITLEKLASQVRIPLDHVIDYCMQALAALSYAHDHGVVHRDIKPANIMITTHGVVKLMDFGIAKTAEDRQLTRPGSTMGSVYYMAPEQIQGGTVDARTDLYSFGVTMYELLTGNKPFQADTSYTILNAQLHEPPRPPVELNPAIPAVLNAIVLQAMAKNPDERFQNAEAFRNALRGIDLGQAAPLPQAIPGAQPSFPDSAPFSTQPPETPLGGATPQPPPFTPVPMPAPPPIATAGPRRGLWIGMGVVIALAALVAVAWILPRVYSTKASQKPPVVASDTPSAAPAPASQPETVPAQPTVPSSEPAAATPSGSAPAAPAQASQPNPAGKSHPASGTHAASGSVPVAEHRPAYVPPSSPAAAAPQPATPAQPSGPSPREIRAAQDRLANLEARADAAFAGVDHLRSQQQAQGLDMRGDIIAAVSRLHRQLDQARQALNQNDLDTAADYMNRADADTSKLEKFLGR